MGSRDIIDPRKKPLVAKKYPVTYNRKNNLDLEDKAYRIWESRRRTEVREGYKQCYGCLTHKKYSEYHKHKTGCDGYSNYCKSCMKVRGVRWKLANGNCPNAARRGHKCEYGCHTRMEAKKLFSRYRKSSARMCRRFSILYDFESWKNHVLSTVKNLLKRKKKLGYNTNPVKSLLEAMSEAFSNDDRLEESFGRYGSNSGSVETEIGQLWSCFVDQYNLHKKRLLVRDPDMYAPRSYRPGEKYAEVMDNIGNNVRMVLKAGGSTPSYISMRRVGRAVLKHMELFVDNAVMRFMTPVLQGRKITNCGFRAQIKAIDKSKPPTFDNIGVFDCYYDYDECKYHADLLFRLTDAIPEEKLEEWVRF